MRELIRIEATIRPGVPGKMFNGGGYRHDIIYSKVHTTPSLKSIEVGKPVYYWDIIYTTTADFDFCSYCGNYGRSCGCEEPQRIEATEDEIVAELRSQGYTPIGVYETIEYEELGV